jgi:anti-sigma regulatory factor (Ser/Thr protein kinase)
VTILRHGHRSIAIEDKSSVGEARRTAIQIAQKLGFDENRRSDIGIVATEAATNVLLHAVKGELLICPFVEREHIWLDIFALDSGPGIHDVSRALEDGVSSIGTAGQGLGAIGRLSDEFSLYTIPDKGTAYWCRFKSAGAASGMPIGMLNIPIRGEVVCGDSSFVQIGPSRSIYMMVDGLGHGSGAAEAAAEAVATVSEFQEQPASEIIVRTHDALKKTRGAAMSIAIVDHERLVMTFAGIGNVSAMLLNGQSSRSLASQNGTLGAALPRVPKEYSFPISRETTLLMFSDGLTTKASPIGYVGLQSRHPALIAGVLFRDFSRRRDDATIMIAPIGGHRA